MKSATVAACRLTERRSAAIMSCAITDPALNIGGSNVNSRSFSRIGRMALIFPNRSRSFDKARKGVSFIGYDDMFEVRFQVEATALGNSVTANTSKAACLDAFDAARSTIQEAACRAPLKTEGLPEIKIGG